MELNVSNASSINDIKLVDVKDMWIGRGITSVDVNDDCDVLIEIFDKGSDGVLVKDVLEFGDEEIVGWITKDKFLGKLKEFKEISECKTKDIMETNFVRISPASTVLAAELKLKNANAFALPIIAVHFGKEIDMGYLTIDDVENIKNRVANSKQQIANKNGSY